mmetsp:Transcript_13603/g.29574  ORF Transcript_13603/g.29574 Transcript_13603/m.29574 type:complete len:283 (-) Transcript_13603:1555-2403(-)
MTLYLEQYFMSHQSFGSEAKESHCLESIHSLLIHLTVRLAVLLIANSIGRRSVLRMECRRIVIQLRPNTRIGNNVKYGSGLRRRWCSSSSCSSLIVFKGRRLVQTLVEKYVGVGIHDGRGHAHIRLLLQLRREQRFLRTHTFRDVLLPTTRRSKDEIPIAKLAARGEGCGNLTLFVVLSGGGGGSSGPLPTTSTCRRGLVLVLNGRAGCQINVPRVHATEPDIGQVLGRDAGRESSPLLTFFALDPLLLGRILLPALFSRCLSLVFSARSASFALGLEGWLG